MLMRNSPLPRNQSAGRGDETPLRTVHHSPPKKNAPRPPPASHASASVSVSFIAILLSVPHRLVLLGNPVPRIQTADGETDDHQRQRPRMCPGMVLIQPGAERGAEQRWHDHRPADQAHHAEPEPNARLGLARLELARRLRADLPGEGRPVLGGFPGSVTHVERSRGGAETPFPTSP